VFGEKDLEKDPLKEVSNEPLHLLAPLIDRLRHSRATKQLEPSKEAHISELLERLLTDCKIKGIQVNPPYSFTRCVPLLSLLAFFERVFLWHIFLATLQGCPYLRLFERLLMDCKIEGIQANGSPPSPLPVSHPYRCGMGAQL